MILTYLDVFGCSRIEHSHSICKSNGL